MMMLFLMSKMVGLISPVSRQTELDKYISSKNPQTGADVEYYIKQFDEEQRRKFIW
jgi:hypothetical protein